MRVRCFCGEAVQVSQILAGKGFRAKKVAGKSMTTQITSVPAFGAQRAGSTGR